MGVLSKLVNAIVPRTISGIIFWAIPIAAAVMVVVYPHAVAKLFVREDPERLLDELTASEGKKKKRPTKVKPALTGNGTKRGGEPSASSNSTDVDKEEPAEMDAPISEEEQLLELANLQGLAMSSKKRPQKTSPPPAKVAIASHISTPISEASSPTLTSIPTAPGKLEDDQEGWTRVPTKEEETVALLKNKLAAALRQYEEAALDAEKTRQLLDKESKKASEAEREVRDRTRSYQLRWVEMETELTNLRSSKNILQERITELLQNATQSEQQQKTVSELEGRIVALEAEVTGIPALQQIVSEAEKEAAGRFAELQSLQDILAEERQALLTERKAKKDLVDRLEASADEIAALMQKLTQEAQERELLAAKLETSERKVSAKETEIQSARSEVSLLEGRLATLNAQIDSLKVELETVLASKATHEEAAINELVAAKESLQEQVSESLATIDSLTQQLSLETAENEDLNKAKQLTELSELAARKEKGATEKLLVEITEKHNTLQAEQERLMAEIKELKAQLEAAEKRAAEAVDTAAIMEKKLAISNKVADAKYTAYQKEIEDLKATAASSVTMISA